MKNKILAVDDSRMMLRIIAAAIEMLEHEPLQAANGKEALAVLEHAHQDVALVLLDWNMPVMDGLATLKAIRADDRFSSIPVMMVTTEGERENVVAAIKSGANHYLIKPFSQQDLATRILESLGHGL